MKRVFDPFVTLWGLHGPERVTTDTKWAKTFYLSIQNGLGLLLEKHFLRPFVTQFGSQDSTFSNPFWDFAWAKTSHHALKMN